MDGPLRIGETFLGKYEVRAEIGRGGHAVVYHAVHNHLHRHLAIKILYRRGGLTEEMLLRGQQEAALLGQFDHPNIVKVHDAGTDGGYLYLVMELLRGRTLRQVLRTFGPLHMLEVLDIAEAVVAGLVAAHERDIIHRDLKPENVFVSSECAPKILDFGIAKAVGAKWQTHLNCVPGTPGYMSPEQLLGRKATPGSDLHAFGLMFYEMVTGVHPLLQGPGERPSKQELVRRLVEVVPPRLDWLVPTTPDYIARVAKTLVAKDPAQRPDSAKRVLALLRAYRVRFVAEYGDAPRRDLAGARRPARPSREAA